MVITNLHSALKNAPLDPQAGIRVLKMAGDGSLAVFASQVLPHTRLRPHYHTQGAEIYQVISGSGMMRIGQPSGTAVIWGETFGVTEGDVFTIEAGQVHQVINSSSKILTIMFSCPEAHLSTDRTFVEDTDA